MLGLLLLPALLGVGLIWHLVDDDDDDSPAPDPESVDVPEDISTYIGTGQDEIITARDAGGIIEARGGDDTVIGSDNADSIAGEAGDDVIYANDGDDAVLGGQGDDRIFLGDGDDTSLLNLRAGEDDGDDFIRGGAGDDTIIDLVGSNQLFGDVGNDTLIAFDIVEERSDPAPGVEPRTPDTLQGGIGNDELAGDDGDIMTGGVGADSFFVAPDLRYDQDEVIITDFNTDEDVFGITLPTEDTTDRSVEFVFDPVRDAVIARFQGADVAVLQGLRQDDIPNIQSAMVA